MSDTKRKTLKLPEPDILLKAIKLSIKIVKPIDMYFYIDTLNGLVCITNDRDSEDEDSRILYKNDEEQTTPIMKTYKVGSCFLVETENSIYIVPNSIQIK